MTIRMPHASWLDRVLKLIGKKRGVRLPDGALGQFGQHVYAKAMKENFWSALFRPSGQPLPEGYIDLFEFEDFRKDIADSTDS